MKEVDTVEIENLWKISLSYPQLDTVAILKAYLHNPARVLSDYHVKEFLFQDNELQRRVVDEIKSHKDFNTLVKNTPEFRVRIREVYPQLLGEFSPFKNPEDALELKYFLRRSRLLRDYENYIDPQQPSERKIQDLLEKARKKLINLNTTKSAALIANLSDYDLLKRYDSLHAELKIRDL